LDNIIDLGCLISNRRLRSFYDVKLILKSEPSVLKLMAEIDYNVKLHACFYNNESKSKEI